MADGEKKPASSAAKPAAANPPNMILIIIFIFVAAFGGTFLAFQLAPKTITVNQTLHEAREPREGDMLPIRPIGDFVVNLADVSGSRFLKLSLTAKVYSEDFENYAKLDGEKKHAYHMRIDQDLAHTMPAIKDVVITLLSRKTTDEVIGYENKLALKEELKKALSHVMHGEFKVYDLYFTEFIVQ
jgi:flagellar protein FliL